jgi:hypothetical protein
LLNLGWKGVQMNSPSSTIENVPASGWTLTLLRHAAVASGVVLAVGAESLIVGAAFVYAVAAGFGLDAEPRATPSE